MTAPTENSQDPQQAVTPNSKEDNLVLQRKMYERQLGEERKAREQMQKRLDDLEATKSRNARNDDVDDDDDSEPYVDKRALKKHLDRFAQNMGQDIDRRAEEKARALLEQERQANFVRSNADFNTVFTEENIIKFAEKHPEIAEPMLKMPDNFARQQLLYQNIKLSGITRKEEPKSSIQDTINKNQRSPYYQPSSAGAAPPYESHGDFSKKGQENAYQKMKELINNRRG